MSLTIEDLKLRPVREPDDMPLLECIYASSRDYETPYYYKFTESELKAFLVSQCHIQHNQYMNAPDADFYIIETLDGTPLGRFYIREMSYPEIRVIDIAILPEHRRKGVGKALFRQTINRAGKEGKRVSIHVEQNNPAHLFYEKLGFGYVHMDGIYDLMVWPASDADISKKAQEIEKAIARSRDAALSTGSN